MGSLRRCSRLRNLADDGPGVADEAIDHLFEPFCTTKSGGTGLGLSMATQVVTAHGGTLDYVARAGLGPNGRGACFTLTLPAAPSVGATS